LPALVLLLLITSDALLKSYAQPVTYPYALCFFLAAVLFFFYYFKTNDEAKKLWDSFFTPLPETNRDRMILAGILLLGCFLRFWKLGSLFDGMTYDEAYKGLDGIAIREFGERPIFLDWNGGREALVAYAVAASQWIFNGSILSVRFVTAVAGSLTLVFWYLFTKNVFNVRVSLISTFLLAISKWHIIHSRYGVRAGLYPLFEVATLYFLVRGFTSNRRNTLYFIVAGLIGALGFYTYIGYRIFPLVVVMFFAQKSVRQTLRTHWKPLVAAAIVAIVLIIPTAVFYVQHAASLTSRMKRTQLWSQKDKGNPARLLVDSTAATLGMFTFRGDPIARHNMNSEPMLSPFITASFVLGMLLVIANIRKKWAFFLLFYFLITIVPGILSVGAPNVPRNFGCLPVVCLFSTLGIYALSMTLRNKLAPLVLGVILAGAFLTGFLDAMIRFPASLDSLSPKISALWGMDRDQTNVAKLINQLGPQCQAFASPQFFFHSTVEYLTYSKSTHRLLTLETELPKDKVGVVFLQTTNINPWWLRDDEDKRFFKWWNQVYGMETPQIKMIIRKTYDPPFTNTSDRRLLKHLMAHYPSSKLLRFENFQVLIVKQTPTSSRLEASAHLY
jgi:uncharacterized membrane protein